MSDLSWWADIATFVGVAITLFGFTYTIIRVNKSKSAAEDAKDAIQNVSKRFYTNKVNRATQLARELPKLLRNGEKIRSSDRAEELASLLRSILGSLEVSNDRRTTLLKSVHTLNLTARTLSAPNAVVKEKMIRFAQFLSGELSEFEAELRQKHLIDSELPD